MFAKCNMHQLCSIIGAIQHLEHVLQKLFLVRNIIHFETSAQVIFGYPDLTNLVVTVQKVSIEEFEV